MIVWYIFLSSQEGEQAKSDSSENQEENPVIENNAETKESPESAKTQHATEAVGCVESSGENKIKEENIVEENKKKDEEQKVCGGFTFVCHITVFDFSKFTCKLCLNIRIFASIWQTIVDGYLKTTTLCLIVVNRTWI